MGGIQGIGGVPGPAPDRPGVPERSSAQEPAPAQADGVAISGEARRLAEVARFIEATKEEPDVRYDKVEAARESLARGAYRSPERIEELARRLSDLI